MKTLKKNIEISFSFYISLIPIIFSLSMAITFKQNNLDAFMFGFIIVYVYTVIFSIIYFGILSIYCIFLYTSAFFIYNCFFFSLFCNENFLLQTFPVKHLFTKQVGFIFIIVCYVTVFVMHISYCLISKKKYKKCFLNIKNINLCNFGKILMLVFFIPSVVKLIIQFNFIRANGYLAMYTSSFDEIKYPIWTAGSFIFFTSGYCLFLASRPNRKEYLFFTMLCFFVYFANALKGQRGGFLSITLYFIYYYTKYYGKRISLKKMFILFVLGFFFIVWMGNLRKSYGNNEAQKRSEVNFIQKTLYTQTTTRAVPMYIIQGNLKYHQYPFIFSSFINPIAKIKYPSASGQNVVAAEHYNKMSAVITYNISKKAYLNGNGIGSAFIAEAYDFLGLFGVIIFSILLSKFFVYCDYSKLHVKRILVPLLFFVLQGIPILPRSNFFRFIDLDSIKIIFAYIFLGIASILPMLFCVRGKIKENEYRNIYK